MVFEAPPALLPNLCERSDVTEYKTCDVCEEHKGENGFYPVDWRRPGRRTCRDCVARRDQIEADRHRTPTLLLDDDQLAECRQRETLYRRAWALANPGRDAVRLKDYFKTHPEKSREVRSKRRAQQHGGAVLGPVDYAEIRQRDRDICWLCGLLVAENEINFDHAVPLAKGGEHSTRNVRVTHERCNKRKHAKDVPHQRFLL